MKGKYLITADAWFLAPDGKQYRAAWGEVEVIDDSILGLKTNRNSTNWFAKIGNDEKHIIIAGCQIHYAIKCENKPHIEDIFDWIFEGVGGYQKALVPTKIYIAE